MRMVTSKAKSPAAVNDEEAVEKGRNISGTLKALQEDRDRLADFEIGREAGRIAADCIVLDLVNLAVLIPGKAWRPPIDGDFGLEIEHGVLWTTMSNPPHLFFSFFFFF